MQISENTKNTSLASLYVVHNNYFLYKKVLVIKQSKTISCITIFCV